MGCFCRLIRWKSIFIPTPAVLLSIVPSSITPIQKIVDIPLWIALTGVILSYTVNAGLADTLLLHIPRYYGHNTNPQLNKTTKKWLKRTPAITDTRYFGRQILVLRVSVIATVDFTMLSEKNSRLPDDVWGFYDRKELCFQ